MPRGQLSLAAVMCHAGEAEPAKALCRESVEIAQENGDDTSIQLVLDILARIASLEGDPERAAGLLGAADALYQAMGVAWQRNPFAPPPPHSEFVAHVREQLGQAVYATLTTEARAWPLDRILALAFSGRLG